MKLYAVVTYNRDIPPRVACIYINSDEKEAFGRAAQWKLQHPQFAAYAVVVEMDAEISTGNLLPNDDGEIDLEMTLEANPT